MQETTRAGLSYVPKLRSVKMQSTQELIEAITAVMQEEKRRMQTPVLRKLRVSELPPTAHLGHRIPQRMFESGTKATDHFTHDAHKIRRRLSLVDVNIDVLKIGRHRARIEDDGNITFYALQFLSQLYAAFPLQHVVGNRAANRRLGEGCDCIRNIGYAKNVKALFFENGLAEFQLCGIIVHAQ